MGSIAEHQIANVQEMERALDQETSTELRVTQEKEDMTLEQETQMTFLGSNPTYIRFIASMGITHEMIRNSIGQIHEVIICISHSAYQEEDLPLGQEIEVKASVVEVDMDEVTKEPQKFTTEIIRKPQKGTIEMMGTDGIPATTNKDDHMEMMKMILTQ